MASVTGSLQLSPLAGRILFKDVRYHSTNMSARVLLGHVTWRYWKWRVRKEDSNGLYLLFHLSGSELMEVYRGVSLSLSDPFGRPRMVPL